LLAAPWGKGGTEEDPSLWSGGFGLASEVERVLKSPIINVLIIAMNVNIHRVTGPDVPVNFSPANSKARFEPVTISSDRTIVKAMTDAKATAPNIAKLGCIGEFHHILTPIIKDMPRKIQPNIRNRNIFKRKLTSGRF
jgi:hypothetical protein